jgi:hypothetical protein
MSDRSPESGYLRVKQETEYASLKRITPSPNLASLSWSLGQIARGSPPFYRAFAKTIPHFETALSRHVDGGKTLLAVVPHCLAAILCTSPAA